MQQVRRMILQKRKMNRRRRYVGYDFDGGLSGGNEYCRYCEQKSAVVDAGGTGIIGGLSIEGICRALIPGIILVAIALSTKKAGWADGVVLLLLGIQTNYEKCMVAVLVALFLMAVLSVVLLVLRKVKKDTKLPFIPFLAMGWFLGLFLTGSIYTLQTV